LKTSYKLLTLTNSDKSNTPYMCKLTLFVVKVKTMWTLDKNLLYRNPRKVFDSY